VNPCSRMSVKLCWIRLALAGRRARESRIASERRSSMAAARASASTAPAIASTEMTRQAS
ncbi:MAG TPA: hypothetical protein VGQ73_09910, partial [Gemmatimonadales bacterium]|nr:hypothetical protein [Gemmatimonadales bacterium]